MNSRVEQTQDMSPGFNKTLMARKFSKEDPGWKCRLQMRCQEAP